MRELTPPQVGACAAATSRPPLAVQISMESTKCVLCLKSWRPEHIRGGTTVALGGVSIPTEVGHTQALVRLGSAVKQGGVLCVGPAEWLVISEVQLAPAELAVDGWGFVLIDLTHAFAAVGVQGAASRELLAKGCGVDFDARAFRPGSCARTRFAQIPAVIQCVEEERFRLHVGRSYLDYLRAYLSDAAVEFESG